MFEKSIAQKATGSIRNSAIDAMKLILSVFVVMIHSELDIGILTPFLRTAVPLFFITSGYYFFRKIEISQTIWEQHCILRRFLKRNMILYGFWFVVLLPITLYIRDWFSGSALKGILKFLQSFLFNSTFRASWYIMALNIGMCIALLLSRKLSAGMQVLFAVPIYLLCCLFTNYYGIAARFDAVMYAYHGYISVFRSLSNSFPAALFWLSLGRYFAQTQHSIKKPVLYALAAFSAAALVAEYILVSWYGLSKGDDAYLMLIFLCGAIFCLVKNMNCGWKMGRYPGCVSTIIYASHASVITVVGFVVRRLFGANWIGINWLIFVVSMAACAAICVSIFVLEKRQGLRWLRYAY